MSTITILSGKPYRPRVVEVSTIDRSGKKVKTIFSHYSIMAGDSFNGIQMDTRLNINGQFQNGGKLFINSDGKMELDGSYVMKFSTMELAKEYATNNNIQLIQ